ncbi:MAG: hypothetical protein ACM3MF_08580 [Anaerolineae bacterium]
MQLAPAVLRDIKRNLWGLPLALVFGTALGLFVNGYWLGLSFPPASKLLILVTLVVAVLGSLLGWPVFRWLVPRFASLSSAKKVAAVLIAVLVGAFLLFGGTAAWQSPNQYIGFLLPSHHLRIVADGDWAPNQLSVMWITTSIGDVSYDAVRLHGWTRSGDKLLLKDPANNWLEWAGRTGEDVQITFHASGPPSNITVSWDGEGEQVAALSGQSTHNRHFNVPWFSSRAMILSLGVFLFAALSLALLLFIWERRDILAPAVRESIRLDDWRWSSVDTAVLLAAMVLAAALRLPDLGKLSPAVDEYFHLIAARQLAEGAAMSSVYGRSLWVVTLPVSLAFRLFGYQLWAARLVGALFNVLAVWPLYLLTRRIGRPVAALSVLLFATSPWLVTFARVTREYAYYPFLFCWILLGMIVFLEGIPRGSVFARDLRSIFRPGMIALGVALLLPPVFALFIDKLSTFRVILLAYLVFAVFVLARFSWQGRNALTVLGVLTAALLLTGYSWYARDSTMIVPVPRFNPVPVEYFLPNPPQQWYYGRLTLLAALLMLVAVAGSYIGRRQNPLPAFLVSVYLTGLGFFAFLSKMFFHTRHLSATQLWYVILMAMGAYFAWVIWATLRPRAGWLVNVLISAGLVLSLVNVGQLLFPIRSTEANNPISEDYLHDMTAVQEFMLAHVQPGDALISTVYGLYSAWQEEPHFAASSRITTETAPGEVLALIDQHESGWIVIDEIRLGMSTLGRHAFAGNPDVEYIGLFGDQNVWHWQHSPAGVGDHQVVGKAPWIFRW